MKRLRKRTKRDYCDALAATCGLVSQAAELLGVSRRAVYNMAAKHADVRQALDDARERTLDLAESKLHKLIEDENITAIIFYLKTIGKGRGYVERMEQLAISPAELQQLSDEELERLAEKVGLRYN
jgi:predicted transcriptional regulator